MWFSSQFSNRVLIMAWNMTKKCCICNAPIATLIKDRIDERLKSFGIDDGWVYKPQYNENDSNTDCNYCKRCRP